MKTLIYILSVLLYRSDRWSAYVKQITRLDTFCLRNLRHTVWVNWRDKVSVQSSCDDAGVAACTQSSLPGGSDCLDMYADYPR